MVQTIPELIASQACCTSICSQIIERILKRKNSATFLIYQNVQKVHELDCRRMYTTADFLSMTLPRSSSTPSCSSSSLFYFYSSCSYSFLVLLLLFLFLILFYLSNACPPSSIHYTQIISVPLSLHPYTF